MTVSWRIVLTTNLTSRTEIQCVYSEPFVLSNTGSALKMAAVHRAVSHQAVLATHTHTHIYTLCSVGAAVGLCLQMWCHIQMQFIETHKNQSSLFMSAVLH